MRDITDDLEILPLNEKEKHVLVALYEHGAANAGQIALRTQIERTLAYKILKELVREHYVQETKTNRGLLYKAREIENVIFEFERKLAALKNAGGKIAAARTKRIGAIDILVLEGKEGIREALYYGMEQGRNEDILGIYSDVYQPKFVDIFNERYHFSRRRNIGLKVVFPVNSKSASDFISRAQEHKYSFECRFSAPRAETEGYFMNSSIEIFRDVYKIYSYQDERALIISDKQIVDAEKFVFDALWKGSSPTRS